MGVCICNLTTFMAWYQPDKPQGVSFEQVFGTAGPIAAVRLPSASSPPAGGLAPVVWQPHPKPSATRLYTSIF